MLVFSTLHHQKPVAIHIKHKRNDKKMHKVQTFNYLNLTPEVGNKYHNHGEMIIVWQRVLELNFIEQYQFLQDLFRFTSKWNFCMEKVTSQRYQIIN